MRYFITGGAGFIGSNLADKLLNLGQDVVAFDNFDPFYSEEIKRKNISDALKSSNYKLIEGDILDKAKLFKSLADTKPEVVIHLAARGGVRPSIEKPELYYEINVTGTLNVLEAMRESGINKMIFASSSSVYGNNSKVPFSETDSVDNPISPYAASKKAGELLCHTYHHLYGFNIFCLRFFTVYGPRQRPDLAINKFFKAVLSSQPITIYGDGTTKRDYTYIDDITDGVLAAINHLKGYEIINLGGSDPVSLVELIIEIETATGLKAQLVNKPLHKGDVALTYADVVKAKKLLGYKPLTNLGKGIALYYNWLKDLNR